MAQTRALVAALKKVLKSRGMTYAEVARGLKMSEASVKRVFAGQTFTLQRLDRICELLGIEITDLGKMVEHDSERLSQLTRKQEAELVADPKFLLVAVHAHQSLDARRNRVDLCHFPGRMHPLPRALDRLRIIDLLPDNRIKVLVARNFSWLPDGPIQRHFGAQVQTDFLPARSTARVSASRSSAACCRARRTRSSSITSAA